MMLPHCRHRHLQGRHKRLRTPIRDLRTPIQDLRTPIQGLHTQTRIHNKPETRMETMQEAAINVATTALPNHSLREAGSAVGHHPNSVEASSRRQQTQGWHQEVFLPEVATQVNRTVARSQFSWVSGCVYGPASCVAAATVTNERSTRLRMADALCLSRK